MKFIEKPKKVEAQLFDGNSDALMSVVTWAQNNGYIWYDPFTPAPAKGITMDAATGFLGVSNGDEVKFAQKGDWLVKDVAGNIRPMASDVFNATYAQIADEPPAAPESQTVPDATVPAAPAPVAVDPPGKNKKDATP